MENRKVLELKDYDNGIAPEHEQEVCNLLEVIDCRNFLNKILYDKCTYSIDAVNCIKAYQYLSQFYILPVYY